MEQMLQTTKLQRLFFFLFGAILCQNLQAQTISCPGNLLLNPSFEITSTNLTPPPINTFYTPASWVAPQRCYADHDWLRPDGIGHIGLFGTGNSVASQNVTVTVGNFYSLTLYSAMHVPLVNQGRAVLQYYDASNNPIGTGVQHTVTHDWDVDSTFAGPYLLALPAAPANASYVRVTLENQNPTASGESVKFDALCLTTAAPISISGNVFDDANGLADNIVNGTGTNGGGLFANLVDANGNVYTSTGVSAGGVYSFTNVPQAAYSIILTTTSQTVGAALSTATLPTGYVATGENNCVTTANCTGNDGPANGVLSLGVVTTDITQANFGITQAGYIYVQKKTLDESSSVDFTYNVSGGFTTVPAFQLNDKPEVFSLIDIGASQLGRLWAVGRNNNTLYYRDLSSAVWVATGVTDASRVDGGTGNTCYYITTSGNANAYDGTTSTNIYNGGLATDIGCAWDNNPYIVANSGRLYRYTGSGVSTHGGASWPQVGSSTTNQKVDGNPATGDVLVSRSDNNVYVVTSTGTSTSLGRPAGSSNTTIFDVAATATGEIFVTIRASSDNSSRAFKWQSGTIWSAQEETSRAYSQAMTAGLGGQVWGLFTGNNTSIYSQNIYTRTFDGTTALWLNDERVRTNNLGNSIMIPVIPGTYTVTETVPGGWDLQHLYAYDPTTNSSTNLTSNFSTLNVGAGEVVATLFENGIVNPFAMTNSCATSYLEDFGTGAAGTYGLPLTGQTSYHYIGDAATTLADAYKIVGNANMTFSGAFNLNDHTAGNGQGRMMAVDANNEPDAFFRRRFTGLVVGATYNFSAWIANINSSAPIKPNVTFEIINPANYVILNSANTGDIATAGVWNQYGLSFTATNSTVDLVIRNNGLGGSGNDLALDDISFQMLPSTIPITTVVNTSCGVSTGTITIISPLGASYEYSKDGTNWQTTVNFTGLTPGIYTISARFAGTTGCVSTKQDTVKAAICGNVFNDVNGLSDNAVNGTGTNASGTLKMVLYDVTSGKVMQVVNVASDGTYSFVADTLGHNYSLYLTTTTPTIGQTAVPVVTLPAGWVSTGENLGAGAGNDGTVNSILNIGVVNANVTNANFGITPPGYIYIHKKTLDESSSVDFTFNVSGGSTAVPSFQLNDKPDWARLRDIGSSQSGRIYAVGLDNPNTLYYRDAGSSQWISTGITNIYRVDGGAGNTCYYIDWNKDTYSFDGVSTSVKISGWNGSSPTFDIGSTWDSLPYVTTDAGKIYRYNGTPFSWSQIGVSANNQFIDGDPASGNIIVSKTDNNVYRMTSVGAATNLGRAPGLSASSNAYDVAADADGQVYAIFENSALDKYAYKWQSGTTWSSKEVTSRIVAGVNYPLTGGIGGQMWLVYDNYSSDMYGTIFSRSTDGSNVWWVDDERVRISPANGNSVMIAVAPGSYTVTETVPSGWDLQDIELYDPTSNSSKNVVGNNATLTVAAGETVHAIFRNGVVNPFAMTNNCGTAYLEDFGTGAVGTYGGPLTGQTSYHLSQSTTNIEDGYYKVVSRTNPDAATWASSIFDHTSGNGTGRMMVVNAAYDQNEFFRRRFTGLITGANYSFSAWVANISGGIPPNMRFSVIDPVTYTVLASATTGDITSSGVWLQYSLNFAAASSTIDLVLMNNSIGGGGNDLALDDIRFVMTTPTTPITTVVRAGCGSTGSITVTSPIGAVYEYSKDGGATWQSGVTFGALNPGTYTISVRFIGSTGCVTSKVDTLKAAICGNVFNDINGLTDNTVNGIGTNTGTILYAILYNNTTGEVADTVAVAADGTYSLEGVTGNNYSVYLSTTPVTIGQAAVPVTTLPLGWVSTGENLGAGAGNDGTVNSILNIGLVNANVTNVNFGIEQPPTAGSGIQNGGNNPGGTTQVTVNANSFTNTAPSSDPSPGGVTAIRITSFPTGATTIVINGVSYTSGTFPVGGVMVPTNASGQPTQTITVDPTFNGSGSVTIPFVAVDAAGKESDNTGTAVINFSNTISGNVYNDANGLTDNTVNGTGTNAGGLNAVLIDANTGLVVASATVAANGTYNFSGVNDGNYTVLITTNTATVGNTPPAVALPAGWISTGENLGAGAGNDGTVNGILPLGAVSGPVTNANFGIERLPSANAQSQTVPYPTGNVIPTGSLTTAVSGTDPEDGSMGNGNTVQITQLPTGTTQMYYDADGPGGNPPALVTLNQQIPNFNPANLSFTNIPNGTSSIVFNYAFVDAAGLTGTPATYTINWVGVLPISLHGFSAQVLGCNNVSLRWQVSNAISFSHFELQRSIDGTNFNTITTITYSNASLLYLYMDGGLEKGQYQYRLKLVDMDGRYSYGPSINSNVTCASKGIVLQPNPARENVTITGLKSGATVMLYDIANKLVLSKKATGNQLQLLLHNIAPGNYNVVVLNEAGNKIDTKPLVKLNN